MYVYIHTHNYIPITKISLCGKGGILYKILDVFVKNANSTIVRVNDIEKDFKNSTMLWVMSDLNVCKMRTYIVLGKAIMKWKGLSRYYSAFSYFLT